MRRALPAEAGRISNIAFRSKAYWGYSDEFMRAYREELTYDAATIEAPQFEFWCYETDGRTLGFYAIDQQTDTLFELEALFVVPDYIGKGIGRRLIMHAMQQSRIRGGQRLIIQGDPNVEEFYRVAGAVRTGERESGSVAGRMLPVFEIDLSG